MSSSPPLLEVRGLVKSYHMGDHVVEVLRGLDLRLESGQTLAIVGTSGVGKSTLLHILGTLDLPTKGQVLFDGRDICSETDERLAAFRNQAIGFVFQFHYLLPELNALENVMLPAFIGGRPRQEACAKAEELLGEVGLGRRLGHRVGQLSGGEQQRVAVARALVRGPRLLLADEPTGNLDQRTGEEIHDLLLTLNRTQGLAMIVVTHNTALARRMRRCITIEDGLAKELEGFPEV
ncbi:MAG: ABC transporter ATP-binding protein [Pseudomonadota bacterium]